MTLEKKPNKYLQFAVLGLLLVGYILALVWANSGNTREDPAPFRGVEYENAQVLGILEDNTQEDPAIEGRLRGSQVLELEILTGRYQGQRTLCTNYFSAMYNVEVEMGDTISVRVDTVSPGSYTVNVYNYNRVPAIILVALTFVGALVAICGWRSLRILVGLVFTFVSIMYLLLPLALKGWSTVPVTMVLVTVTATASFWLLGGWQPKTLGATLGCFCGVAGAAILGSLAAEMLHVSAYQMDEAEALLLARGDTGLKLEGLLLSGILISAEGAVMDTAMSVASAMAELKEKKPEIGLAELFRSGMHIGKDTTGTMANTLVLAFAGSSFNMMILIYSYQVSFLQLMNTDFVAVELVRSVAGSLGIILTVPCVAIITAALLCRKQK